MNNLKKLVAVVTPIVRFPLPQEEEISLRHLRQHLGRFDRYIIGQDRLPAGWSDFRLKKFPAKYFADLYAYNQLMVTKRFYEAFADYEYILIYQTDCLVFSDALEAWCARGWDYVGAPWLKNRDHPEEGFSSVGNGGLSLRRVRSALAVLNSELPSERAEDQGRREGKRSKHIFRLLGAAPMLKRAFVGAKTALHQGGYHNNVRWLTKQMVKNRYHEDYFWAFYSRRFLESFRIPEPQQALAFSFEMAPRYCFGQNANRLPFGCHAWARYDRDFWEPYLLGTGVQTGGEASTA
jgi:hypothetical protein